MEMYKVIAHLLVEITKSGHGESMSCSEKSSLSLSRVF